MALKSFLLFCILFISLSCIKQRTNQYEIDCNYETKLAKMISNIKTIPIQTSWVLTLILMPKTNFRIC